MILSPEGHAPQAVFSVLVVEEHPWVVDDQRQTRPQPQNVGERLAKVALGQRLVPQTPPQGTNLGPEERIGRVPPAPLALDGIQLPDEVQKLLTRLRIVWLRLGGFEAGLRPAAPQDDRRPPLGRSALGSVAVRQDDPRLAVKYLMRRPLPAAGERPVDHRFLPRPALGLPALRALLAHQAPSCFVRSHRLRVQDAPRQRLIGEPQQAGQDLHPVSERLGVGGQPLPAQNAHLSLEQQVVKVPGHHLRDGELGSLAGVGLELDPASSSPRGCGKDLHPGGESRFEPASVARRESHNFISMRL